MNFFLDEHGLTFVEMMVSVVMIGVLVVGFYGLLDNGMAMYQTGDAHLEQIQHMRVAMEAIGRDIRRAKSVSFESSDKRLTLTLPGDTEKKYILDRANESIYSPSGLEGKKLWVETKGKQPLASYLHDFEVRQESRFITVILKAQTPKGKLLTLQSSFTFRN